MKNAIFSLYTNLIIEMTFCQQLISYFLNIFLAVNVTLLLYYNSNIEFKFCQLLFLT